MKKIFLLASLAFSINAFAQIPTNGLIGYYPFTGNANDQSGNSNNGTVTGAILTTDRFGNTNSAYSFNGTSDLISFPQLFAFNQTGDASISIWINSNTPPSNVQATFLKSNLSTPDNNRFNFFLNPLSGDTLKLNFDYRETNSTIHILNICNTLTKYNWQNIVYSRTGNTYKLYVNGQLINSSVDNAPNLPTATGWLVGNDPSSIHDFSGKIDDIRIYSRALDSVEVNSIFNEGLCYQYITVTDTLIINTNMTGFNPVTYQNTIKIYPNPANDHITIDNGNIANLTGYQMKITNSLGQQVFQSAINQQQFYVSLSTWTGNGIYFVHIIDGQGNTIDIKKIVLQ
jgi:hypothetical protein